MSSGGVTTRGVPKGASNQSNNLNNNKKSSKSDSKSDKNDLNPKIQATAEQMQIARIIDTHRAEDPELQKKIRQVMEFTRTTEDQACMALHSREYDIEQAITLLTDGGSQSLESEWAQAGKKRKQKTQNPKADGTAQKDQKGAIKDSDRGGRDKLEKRDSRGEKKDSEGGDQTFISSDQRRGGGSSGGGGPPPVRGLGRGRGGPRLSGRGGRSDKENDEMRGGRPINGPGPGRGGRGMGFGRGGRGGGRTFANRARGEREGDSYNTIDVWENSQADGAREAPLKVEKWDEFPSAEDWDNEEYTGSLADTKVFTPSTQTAQGPLNDATNGVGGGTGAPSSNHVHSSSNNMSSDVNKVAANQEAGVTLSSVVQGIAGSGGTQSLDISMLLQKTQQNSVSSVSSHNAGADLLATLQSSYSASNQVPVGVSNQALPQRNRVQKPRGPPSKIPSSAVEMPDDSVTALDVQFGGMDMSSDPSMSFSSVMQGGKMGGGDGNLMYGKMDSYVSNVGGDKDLKSGGHSSVSPFQNQMNSSQSQGGSLVDQGKGNNIVSPGLDSLSSLSQQNQSKTQQTVPGSYGAAVNVNAGSGNSSAFVSYGKGAPGFPAPGFPPVSQNPAAGTYNNSNIAPVTGGPPPNSYVTQQQLSSQTSQSGYHHMGNMTYGNQVSQNIPQNQQVASANPGQNSSLPYGTAIAGSVQPQSSYHLNSNVNSGYSNSSTGNTQYGGYTPKMTGSLNSTGVKDNNITDVNASASSTPISNVSSQMGSSNMHPGSATSASSNTKLPTSTNPATSAASKMGGTGTAGMPPGMVMQPQYILGQSGTVPTFYSVQTPMYGYDDNVQFVPRFPPNMTGYYDATAAAGYVTGAGVPGAGGRNDGAAMQAYSTGADGRFTRSDSSTASPVPSNLAGGNTQQAMYNPAAAMPYYAFVGNNMVHGTHFPYGPPHHMYQAPMATATNTATGAQHAATANHQYQGKYTATQYTYDASQGGPTSDFGKTSYNTSGSGGVGPNSNTGKTGSGSTPGSVSQSTDLNSSMYSKSHNMGKMNSYDKQYGSSGAGAYNSLGGAQPSQLGGAGMGTPYGVYIAQQPVQTLPMHQDGTNASRQGPGGQQKGKQQYGGQQPYWNN